MKARTLLIACLCAGAVTTLARSVDDGDQSLADRLKNRIKSAVPPEPAPDPPAPGSPTPSTPGAAAPPARALPAPVPRPARASGIVSMGASCWRFATTTAFRR